VACPLLSAEPRKPFEHIHLKHTVGQLALVVTTKQFAAMPLLFVHVGM
jgi:hypothetical protein